MAIAIAMIRMPVMFLATGLLAKCASRDVSMPAVIKVGSVPIPKAYIVKVPLIAPPEEIAEIKTK